jgi:hypothetical protein
LKIVLSYTAKDPAGRTAENRAVDAAVTKPHEYA